jgi:SAM-dependent methyltransferase
VAPPATLCQAGVIITNVPEKRSATVTDEAASHERVLNPPPNLDFLLRRRTQFVRDFVRPNQQILEVGSGLGITRAYVAGVDMWSTDARPKPWVDAAVDVQALPYAASSFDAALAMHVLHHVPSPRRALHELVRVVRPNGLLLIAEPVASLTVRAVLKASRHEYLDATVDPFLSDTCQTNVEFPGGGNNAIGDRLFSDLERFRGEFPQLTLIHHRFVECLTFINSGGVSVRGPSIPLPPRGLRLVGRIDDALMRFPRIFAMCRELVFRKEADG